MTMDRNFQWKSTGKYLLLQSNKCWLRRNQTRVLFGVDFSFYWINLEASWFSLEQNSCCSCRQAFIYFSRLHQVRKGTEKTALIWDLTGSLSMWQHCFPGSQQSALTTLPPGKAVLTVLCPRKEAIPPLLTQIILGLRQVTAQLLSRQLGAQPGLGLPRQTALFPRWIARSSRQVGLCPLIAPLPRQLAMLVPR